MSKLVTMLRKSAEADKAKALLSLDLLDKKAVGIEVQQRINVFNPSIISTREFLCLSIF